MPTVIIIGFGYYNQSRKLTSTITDIYRLFGQQQQLGRKVYILSDIVYPEKPEGIVKLLSSTNVDHGFLPFLERQFAKIRILVQNRTELETELKKIPLSQDGKLIFYYTGHGVDGNFILPDGEKYSSLELRKNILNMGNGILNQFKSEVLIIIDCCNPHGMYLPFRINQNFNYEENSRHYVKPNIIMLASADFENESQANNNESTFTKYLLKYFAKSDTTMDFKSTVNYINNKISSNPGIEKEQRCTIYTSKVSTNVIWTWTYTSVNVFLDAKTLTLNLTKK